MIQVRRLSKSFSGQMAALESLDLDVRKGERLAILGPSGSGKTTILRLIAGLETPDSGTVMIDGVEMAEIPPHLRDVAMVFQNPSLMPHLRVFDNLAFGLRARLFPWAEINRRVGEIAAILGLERLLQRRSWELSGGEKQRVALGRAVARRPQVLLLDEPFSSLDAPLRDNLRNGLIELQERFKTTTIHVTHDQSEALGLGHRVAVLDRGKLMQIGTPEEIYDHPAHRFVASFVGQPAMNVLRCEAVRPNGEIAVRLKETEPPVVWSLAAVAGQVPAIPPGESVPVQIGVRPGSILVVPETYSFGPAPFVAPACLRRTEYQGGRTLLATLSLGGQTIRAFVDREAGFRDGEHLRVILDPATIAWFDAETGVRLPSREGQELPGSTPDAD